MGPVLLDIPLKRILRIVGRELLDLAGRAAAVEPARLQRARGVALPAQGLELFGLQGLAARHALGELGAPPVPLRLGPLLVPGRGQALAHPGAQRVPLQHLDRLGAVGAAGAQLVPAAPDERETARVEGDFELAHLVSAVLGCGPRSQGQRRFRYWLLVGLLEGMWVPGGLAFSPGEVRGPFYALISTWRPAASGLDIPIVRTHRGEREARKQTPCFITWQAYCPSKQQLSRCVDLYNTKSTVSKGQDPR